MPTITIHTTAGERTTEATRIKGTPFAIHHTWTEGQPWTRTDGWTVTHVPTGVALVRPDGASRSWRSRGELRELVLRWWTGCTDKTREIMRRATHVRELADVERSEADRLRVALGQRPLSGTFKGDAINVYSGETRHVSVDESYVRGVMLEDRHDQCSGPCECGPLEPDGTCPKGWPSILRAIGIL